MLREMTGEFPGLSRVFVEERDLFLTHTLRRAARPVPISETGELQVIRGVVIRFQLIWSEMLPLNQQNVRPNNKQQQKPL